MAHRKNLATDLNFGERFRLAQLILEFLSPIDGRTVISDHRNVRHMEQFFSHHRAYIFGLETFLKSKLQGDPLLAKVVPLPFWDSRGPLPPNFSTFNNGPAVAPNTYTRLAFSSLPGPPSFPAPPSPWAGLQAFQDYRESIGAYWTALGNWMKAVSDQILLNPPVTDTNYLNTAYPGKAFPSGSGLDDPASFRDPMDLCEAHPNGRGLGMDITEGLLKTATHYHGITHSSLAGLDTPVDLDDLIQYLKNGGPSVSGRQIGPFMNGGTTAAPFIFWPLHAFFDTLCYSWEEAHLSPVVSPTVISSNQKSPELFVLGKEGIIWHLCHLGDGGPNSDHGSFGNWEHWHRLNDDPVTDTTRRLKRLAVAATTSGGAHLIGISRDPEAVAVHARLEEGCGDPSRWEGLGGNNKEIVALSGPTERLYVFAIQNDDAVRVNRRLGPGSDWSDWIELFPGKQVQVEAIFQGTRAYVFSLGADGLIRHRWETSSGGAWDSSPTLAVLPGLALQPPKFIKFRIARNEDGRLELFAISKSGKLYHRWELPRLHPNTSLRLSVWTLLDDGPCQDLAVGTNSDGRLEVFFASGGNLFHRWQNSPNGGWSSQDSIPLDAPMGSLKSLITGSDAEGRLMVYGVAEDGLVWHAWQMTPSNGPWIGWLVI